MRSLSYKTLIWRSSWFKQNCSQSPALWDKDTECGTAIRENTCLLEEKQSHAKKGFLNWFKRGT